VRKQTITCTTLPNGVEGGNLRLSVFLGIRLETDDPAQQVLEQWPDLKAWPATTLGFDVKFGTLPAAQATRIGPAQATAVALWTSLFPPSTFVRPFAFKSLGDSKILSFPGSGR
jgi:hypothetical protein